jgi:lipopolysaccharide cholinephosphotransferase
LDWRSAADWELQPLQPLPLNESIRADGRYPLPIKKNTTGRSVLVEIFRRHFSESESRVEPASRDLRLIQMGNVALLKRFSEICARHGLQFWADGGTLLGAVRHGGFIAWDDDIDVVMPQESYDRLYAMAHDPSSEFSKAIAEDDFSIKWSTIGQIYSGKMRLLLDIFPWDFHSKLSMNSEEIADFRRRIGEENEKDFNRKVAPDERKAMHDRLRDGQPPNPDGMLFMGAGHGCQPVPIVANGDIFPLKTLQFEGLQIPVPKNPSPVLSTYYGNWKKLPPPSKRVPAHMGKGGDYADEETREDVRKFIRKHTPWQADKVKTTGVEEKSPTPNG